MIQFIHDGLVFNTSNKHSCSSCSVYISYYYISYVKIHTIFIQLVVLLKSRSSVKLLFIFYPYINVFAPGDGIRVVIHPGFHVLFFTFFL